MKPLAVGIASLSLLVSASFAVPALSQDVPEVAQGTSPSETYFTDGIDSIDMATGRLQLHIPLLKDTSQRGNLNFNYNIDYGGTGAWVIVCSPNCTWQPETPGNLPLGPTINMEGGLGQPVWTWTSDPAYWVTGADGAQHALDSASDNTGYRLWMPREYLPTIPRAWAITNNAGCSVGVYPSPGNPYIHNPNGNRMDTWMYCDQPYPAFDFATLQFEQTGCVGMLDTVGRAWLRQWESYDSDCPTNSGANSGANVWTVPGVSGGNRVFKFCYTTIYASVPFGGGNTYQAWPNLLTAAILPDGAQWQFRYDDGYGNLTMDQLPTGGTISYTWTEFSGDYCTWRRVCADSQRPARFLTTTGIPIHGLTALIWVSTQTTIRPA